MRLQYWMSTKILLFKYVAIVSYNLNLSTHGVGLDTFKSPLRSAQAQYDLAHCLIGTPIYYLTRTEYGRCSK